MVPVQKLEVYKLIFKSGEREAPAEDLFEAYMEDLATLRKALREGAEG